MYLQIHLKCIGFAIFLIMTCGPISYLYHITIRWKTLKPHLAQPAKQRVLTQGAAQEHEELVRPYDELYGHMMAGLEILQSCQVSEK